MFSAWLRHRAAWLIWAALSLSTHALAQETVEFLHGAVVREGKARGIPTPVNELLTNTLMALTKKEIPLFEYEGKPEKLLGKLK